MSDGNGCPGDLDSPEWVRDQVRKCLASTRTPPNDLEAFEQEISLHVYQRVRDYDVSRGSPETFVDRISRNKLTSLLRSSRAGRRKFPGKLESLDVALLNKVGEADSKSADVPESAKLRHRSVENRQPDPGLSLDLQSVTDGLPANLRTLCELLSRTTVTEAARTLGIHRDTAYEWIKLIRARFRTAELDGYL